MKTYKLLLEVIHGPSGKVSPFKLHELNNHLSEHYHFNDKESNHIAKYTNESVSLNNYMHNSAKRPLRDDEHKHFFDHAINLENAISNKPAPKDFHVYTGIKDTVHSGRMGVTNPHREDPDNPHASIKAHLPAFTSTSLDLDVAKSFSPNGHILKFHIPKGTMHGAYIADHSNEPSEAEFLLKPNTKIHIHPEPEKHGAHYIYHAKIVE